MDNRTNIFSIGVTPYELFTGRSPSKGIHEIALMCEIVNVDPTPVSSISPKVRPEVDAIIPSNKSKKSSVGSSGKAPGRT